MQRHFLRGGLRSGKTCKKGFASLTLTPYSTLAHSALVQLSLKLDIEDASTFFKGGFEDKKDVKRVQLGHLLGIVLASRS